MKLLKGLPRINNLFGSKNSDNESDCLIAEMLEAHRPLRSIFHAIALVTGPTFSVILGNERMSAIIKTVESSESFDEFINSYKTRNNGDLRKENGVPEK